MTKVKHVDRDSQIAETQARIRLHRALLQLDVYEAKAAARTQLTSPVMLLGAAATGFVLGKFTRRARPDRPAPLGSLWHLMVEAAVTALKFARSGPAIWVASALGAHRAQRNTAEDTQFSESR